MENKQKKAWEEMNKEAEYLMLWGAKHETYNITREFLESEGWSFYKEYGNEQYGFSCLFKKKIHMYDDVERDVELNYSFKRNILDISYDCGEYANCNSFEGNCKTIDDFKTIIKLITF